MPLRRRWMIWLAGGRRSGSPHKTNGRALKASSWCPVARCSRTRQIFSTCLNLCFVMPSVGRIWPTLLKDGELGAGKCRVSFSSAGMTRGGERGSTGRQVWQRRHLSGGQRLCQNCAKTLSIWLKRGSTSSESRIPKSAYAHRRKRDSKLSDLEPVSSGATGRGFESLQAYHLTPLFSVYPFLSCPSRRPFLCQNCAKNGSICPRCAKTPFMFVGSTIQPVESFSHHVQLRLAVPFEYVGVALPEHQGHKAVGYTSRTEPCRERVTQ